MRDKLQISSASISLAGAETFYSSVYLLIKFKSWIKANNGLHRFHSITTGQSYFLFVCESLTDTKKLCSLLPHWGPLGHCVFKFRSCGLDVKSKQERRTSFLFFSFLINPHYGCHELLEIHSRTCFHNTCPSPSLFLSLLLFPRSHLPLFVSFALQHIVVLIFSRLLSRCLCVSIYFAQSYLSLTLSIPLPHPQLTLLSFIFHSRVLTPPSPIRFPIPLMDDALQHREAQSENRGFAVKSNLKANSADSHHRVLLHDVAAITCGTRAREWAAPGAAVLKHWGRGENFFSTHCCCSCYQTDQLKNALVWNLAILARGSHNRLTRADSVHSLFHDSKGNGLQTMH